MRNMLLNKKGIPDTDYVEYEEMYLILSRKIKYSFYINKFLQEKGGRYTISS